MSPKRIRQRLNVPLAGMIRSCVLAGLIAPALAACSANIPTIGTVQRMPSTILTPTEQKKVIDELNAARDSQRADTPAPAIERKPPPASEQKSNPQAA